ncbi:multisubstrate pseudouridine synthase 7 isoform X1 [Panicum miliaceum]|uniref:Multisubstrate pseudouridine synthase 7 isoform X1 n=1 Tax=Panicum miliaceum TaxID=4540 RepID=A0A3L6SZV6_PANMI|nr:multisubstrate pseudouridine synthase 7 isoform X1 [Panicum miliaceum]
MARSSSLSEAEAGISCFASSLPGFRGVLKHRYSDFIVHEVARDGTLVQLTSFDLPTECVDVKEEEKAAPSADADHSQTLESFRALCGDADCEALRGLLERVAAGGDSAVSPVILSPDADKAHRSDVHNFFKKNFKFLVTDTVEHSDGVQRCIRVRLGSGAGGGRGGGGRVRKRKNMGGSDWRDDRPFDSRGSSNWSDHVGKFLRFHLYKENKDTQEALGVIGKMLGLQPRSFGFAGTKDKRAVTSQQACIPQVYNSVVTVFKVQANRLAALNNRLFGIKVGNFWGVIAESEDVIKAAADGLGKNGFINYYGLQRFGSGSVPTHLVGAALLRGEWKAARDDINELRKHYKEHGDIDKALRNFPRHLVAERAILQCLKKCPGNYLQALKGIPRTLRMMQVVEGDLVYNKESPPEESTSVDITETDDVHTNSSETDLCSEAQPEETIQSVKIVDSGDLLKGMYTFDDVVLPLPGSQAIFPGNAVAGIYHEMAKKDGISLTENAHGVKEFSITSMKGGYRRVFQRPIDFQWELMTYTDESSSLAETDLDVLSRTKPKEANELVTSDQSQAKLEKASDTSTPTNGSGSLENKPTGSPDTAPRKLAIKLAFTLPASCYATMAIRELLKTSTSYWNQLGPLVSEIKTSHLSSHGPPQSHINATGTGNPFSSFSSRKSSTSMSGLTPKWSMSVLNRSLLAHGKCTVTN